MHELACTLVPPSSFAVIDPVDDPRWQTLVAQASGASVFHHPAWLRLLSWQYRYPVIACCVLDERGELEAGMPLALVGGRFNRARFVGLPASDSCTPLARDEQPSQWRRLGIALDQLRRRNGLDIELHGELPWVDSQHPLAAYHQHVLTLSRDYDDVVRGMKSQVRRGERRARKEGLEFEIRHDAEALAEFYLLHMRTRRRQGVPTHPRRFIMGFEQLFSQGLGFVLLVRDGDEAVAAAVFLAYRGTLIYKYGASDPHALPKRPNNLLFMEAIRWAVAHGIETLDFGRTDIEHESLSAFKRSFGAEERLLVYTVMSDRAPAPRERGNGAAASVIKRSPPFVSRAVGELLYRDFAP